MLKKNKIFSFKNKNVLVIGASKGLGESLSLSLAENNANLALLSRSEQKLQKLKKKLKNPSNHIFHYLDLEKINSIHDSLNIILKKFKHIDIVYHTAGGGYGFKDALITQKKLTTLFQVNIGGAAEINRIILEKKNRNKITRIIHVGSIASYEAVGSVGYNTVKSSMVGYVRSLGREMYKKKAIITGIMPGGFEAPNNAMHRLKTKNFTAYNKFIKERLPRMKMGNVKEILPLMLLLGTEFSDMMGGCMVPIDAGEGKSYIL